jgi:hypothetical protein
MCPAPKGNKFWQLANLGRKAHYDHPEDLLKKIQEYFQRCNKRGKYTPTISGLAVFLGFSSRSSFDDYSKRGEEFSYIIEQAKAFISACYEQQLYGTASAGAVFALKNMGWKDKVETQSDVRVEVLKAEVEIIQSSSAVPVATSEKDIKE